MKKCFEEAIKKGKDVKTQNFVTTDGTMYTIYLTKHNGHIYFIKCKNGRIVECLDLNELEDDDDA